MGQSRNRIVISHIDIQASPAMVDALDASKRSDIGNHIWMCAYWTLNDSRLVNYNSDTITHHHEWRGLLAGSSPYVDLEIKIIVFGYNPDPTVKGQLNSSLRDKLKNSLGGMVPAGTTFQPRFVWTRSMNVAHLDSTI